VTPSLFEAVEQVLTSLARSLPAGAAALEVDQAAETTSRRTIFLLIPSNPSAARVHVDVEEHSDVVAVTLGRGAVFEVPREGHRYTDLDFLDEIRALCVAAISGELRETVLFKGDEVVGADAKVKVGSIETGDSWRKLTNPLRRPVRRSYEYEPYA
jgi:hypothetical protein